MTTKHTKEKYSVEYWLHHYEYVMGYREKLDIDNSNATWTKTGFKKILNGQFPYGWTGLNGAKALIEFIKLYYPDKLEETINLMIKYIESIKTQNKPLKKIYNYYLSQKIIAKELLHRNLYSSIDNKTQEGMN